VTDLDTLPGSVLTLRTMVAEVPPVVAGGVEVANLSPCATGVTGLATSPGSVPKTTMVTGREGALAVCATGVTGLVTLPVNVPREMVVVGAEKNAEVEEEAEVVEEISDQGMTMVVPSATSATDLVTLPESAGKKKIGATSAMEPDTLPGIAVKMRILATIATRLAIS